MALTITNDDFKFLKKFPALPRMIIGIAFALFGVFIQIFLPINGIFPYEETKTPSYSFIIGLVFLVIALFLLFPERLKISEEPLLADEKPIWTEYTMKQLSELFNHINNREKRQKKRAAYFDLSKPKGRWIFVTVLFGVAFLYILILGLTKKLFFSTGLFLIDLYLFFLPLWFIIRIDYWEPEILRKILFYYQFTQQEDLDELEFLATPAVQLQRVKTPKREEEIMLPLNVRFMIDFYNPPESFDSLSIQIILNEYMGNKFPSFVCFLRIRKPNDWKPLKKDIAYADRIVKIQHMLEEENLHLFVLSKSPKVENPNHTSPRDAVKIFKRAYKMMQDFA